MDTTFQIFFVQVECYIDVVQELKYSTSADVTSVLVFLLNKISRTTGELFRGTHFKI